MSQIGILPLIVGGGLVATGTVISYEDGLLDRLARYVGIKPEPSLPVSSSPVAQPPKAPITLNKLRSWSPDDLAEAEAQRGVQYQRDDAFFRANAAPPKSDWPSIPPPASQDHTRFWLLVAAGLIGAVIIARKL